MIVPETPPPPTLYEWAGGHEALVKLLTIFYGHVLEDPLLEPVFRGMDPEHPKHVAGWLGEVFGGPPEYSASRGGHAHMI
ncbi:oxidoreductase, partial [Amycolatopsis mediterranei]